MSASPRRRRRALAWAAVLTCGAIVAAGCSTAIAGSPLPAGTFGDLSPATGTSTPATPTKSAPATTGDDDPGRFPTVPTSPGDATDSVDDAAVGLKPDAPTPHLDITGLTKSPSDTVAAHALADLFDYYDEIFPAEFDANYQPPAHLVSYDSAHRGGTVCGEETYQFVNAFYAPKCDTVAWDRGVMLPEITDAIGDLAPAVVLSHEIGHDVQAELGVPPSTTTLVLEQQADCYAGAYWRWVADGHSAHFAFNQTEGMRQLLLALFQAHDPVDGTNNKDSENDHGNGFDRTYAATLGYTSGAQRCSEIDAAEVAERSQEFPFTGDEPNYANVEITADVLTEIAATVDDYFTQTAPGYRAPTLEAYDAAAAPDCDGKAAPFPVAYCAATNTVTYSLGELKRIGSPQAGWDSANGDFSAIVLLVSRYALAAQRAGHSRIVGKNAGLRALCYAGTWATWMRTPHGDYSLSPTDLDKAIYEIVSSPVSGSDAAGDSDATIIERVQAFDIGVTHPIPDCFDFYPQ